jgi:hypothetical protein
MKLSNKVALCIIIVWSNGFEINSMNFITMYKCDIFTIRVVYK